MTAEKPTYSTAEVASILGVTGTSVRRYVSEGFLPEPGWVSRGRKRERRYSQEWVDMAKSKLGLTDGGS